MYVNHLLCLKAFNPFIHLHKAMMTSSAGISQHFIGPERWVMRRWWWLTGGRGVVVAYNMAHTGYKCMYTLWFEAKPKKTTARDLKILRTLNSLQGTFKSHHMALVPFYRKECCVAMYFFFSKIPPNDKCVVKTQKALLVFSSFSYGTAQKNISSSISTLLATPPKQNSAENERRSNRYIWMIVMLIKETRHILCILISQHVRY